MPRSCKETGKASYKWVFSADTVPADEFRVRMQVISDIYKAIQTRLDGYRQSSGAVFLAVFASAVAFDSTVGKFFFDIDSGHKLSTVLILLSCSIVFLICSVAFFIIQLYKVHFEEMTSIIFKIDSANGVWTNGLWLENETLYPAEFGKVVNVRRSKHEPPLYGWKDPLICLFQGLIVLVFVLHMLFFLAAYMSLPESMVAAAGPK